MASQAEKFTRKRFKHDHHGHCSKLHLSVFSIDNIQNLIFQTSDQPNLILRCKTCGTPVHSNKTIPPSPTPHLLRTIQAPNASEAIRLREALRHATPVVHQLDDDISHVQMLLDELRRKRELLRKFITDHNAILAPIRRLPAEILAEIFVLCMNSDISSFDLTQSPLLVGQVCKGWRQVALSTQTLWSSITVTDYHRNSSEMAKLWMSRATSAPLTIRLDSTLRHSSTIEPAIAVLVQYCDRWQHLDINFHRRMHVSCLSSIRHHLPLLESLRIQGSADFSGIFQVAPRLQTLCVDAPVSLKVPWYQLTELETHDVNCSVDCLRMLQFAPNLVKCTMYKSTSLDFLPQNFDLTHSHLRFFRILGICPDNIFNHLHLPTIHTLRIGYEDIWEENNNSKWFSRKPFLSLLSCSSRTLRKLEIDDCLDEYEDSTHIAHFLRVTPALEELHLRGPSYHWVTVDLLHLLTRRPNTDVLVPALEVLEISSCSIPCSPSMSMIESRWWVGKGDGCVGARLKKLQFEISECKDWLVDEDHLNRLCKCRQEGMVISIIGEYDWLLRDLLNIPHPSVDLAY